MLGWIIAGILFFAFCRRFTGMILCLLFLIYLVMNGKL